MMDREQVLLVKLAEEASEVSQIALKTALFGLTEVYQAGNGLTNLQRIHAELEDMLAVVEMLNEECNFGHAPDPAARVAKKVKVNNWARYAEHLGRVQP